MKVLETSLSRYLEVFDTLYLAQKKKTKKKQTKKQRNDQNWSLINKYSKYVFNKR